MRVVAILDLPSTFNAVWERASERVSQTASGGPRAIHKGKGKNLRLKVYRPIFEKKRMRRKMPA